jgi:hypothetical protein
MNEPHGRTTNAKYGKENDPRTNTMISSATAPSLSICLEDSRNTSTRNGDRGRLKMVG